MAETTTVEIRADIEPFLRELASLERLAARFGAQMLGAFRGAASGGRQFEDVLRSIGLNLAGMALDHGLKPLAGLAGPVLPGLLKSIVGMIPFASGGVPGRLTPFANGGVVNGPALFPLGRNLGLMGEAGAEAILPLRRGPDGALGVAASGSGGGVNVVFNVSTPDAASFRKSEGQITGMLARAVVRGGRRL